MTGLRLVRVSNSFADRYVVGEKVSLPPPLPLSRSTLDVGEQNHSRSCCDFIIHLILSCSVKLSDLTLLRQSSRSSLGTCVKY